MSANAVAEMEAAGYECYWIDTAEWRKAVQPAYDELIPSRIPQETYDAIMALAPSNNK